MEAELIFTILGIFTAAVLLSMVAAPNASEFREWERENEILNRIANKVNRG